MSVVGLSSSSSSDNMFKKSSHHHHHRRNDSGELDVFEAAKYFSGHANNEIYANTSVIKDYNYNHHHYHHQEKRRLSLDVPMIRNAISTQTIGGGGGRDSVTTAAAAVLVMDHHHHHEKKMKQNVVVTKDNKKLKNNNNTKQRQPSSPGGRLANFLNSLFNQKSFIPSSSSRNKKSTSSSNHDREIINPARAGGSGWRRKRRSSISHFGTTTTTTATATTTTTTTPNKSYKDLNQHVMVANLISNSRPRPATRTSTTKLNIIHNNYDDHDQKYDHDQLLLAGNNIIVNDQMVNWAPEKEEGKELMFKKFNDDYDGEDSDSSSDLFELPNYDLGSCFSSDLPVYETTNMDSIKKSSTTISAAAATTR